MEVVSCPKANAKNPNITNEDDEYKSSTACDDGEDRRQGFDTTGLNYNM